MPGPPPGVGGFLWGQIFQMPPVPSVDVSGQTFIITGANSGLGLDCAKHLARLGAARLILGCRNLAKGEAAKRDILATLGEEDDAGKKSKTSITVWPIDMTRYGSVMEFVERCNSLDRVDGFIANAGISTIEFQLAEGDESTLTVNVLSTFLAAILFLPKLRESAQQYKITPHISIVGSAVHIVADTSELTRLAPNQKMLTILSDRQKCDMSKRYNLSKLLVMLCVQEMASQLTQTHLHALKSSAQNNSNAAAAASSPKTIQPSIIINNVNPGFCRTALFRSSEDNDKSSSVGLRVGLKLIGRTSEQGSRTLVHGVTTTTTSSTAGLESSHGAYLSESRVKQASPFVRSDQGREIGKRFWAEMMEKFERVRPGIIGLL